ncbi:MAG: PLDc N-terminal domain-containing protein, partial [Acetivibrio sp.]
MNSEKHENNDLKEELTGRIKSYLSGFFRVVVVGLLVLVQFLVLALAPFFLRNFTVYFYVVLELLSLIVIINLVNDNRSPSYKIAWITIVLMLPISGHVMYVLWGKADSKRKIETKILAKMRHGAKYLENNESVEREYALLNPAKSRLSRYMVHEGFPIYKNNQVEYFPMGEDAFQSIFLELETAKRFILIDFFIVAEGAIWDKLHEILLRKIKEGVEVKFLYDDFGAMLRTEKHFKRKLEAEGFEVRVINPIHKYTDKLYMNYRSHQKIMVIDGNTGYTGGFNIADEYANIIERFGVWKDNGIRLEGDGVWGLTVTF